MQHIPKFKKPAIQTQALRPVLWVAVCGWLLLSAPLKSAEPTGLLTDFPRANIIIETSARGCILFDIYVAASPGQWEQGLMFIRSLEKFEGMIFVYPEPRAISMWMKNTLIPLDMLFILPDAENRNRIVHVHRNARPHDTTSISAGRDVYQVIELNAGTVNEFGIKMGDRVYFPAG